ncbi:phosphatidylglycerophosphatase [Ascoidea rubescens DSM 1968]|uniref:HAD-superfamily phosphatase n=1 Tax=Ascoidea rubescens DSM 1968 TaxID=1344418 RepID=A0A1D2VK12_9ASCO|nr:HAD-superfamily phosphatase [Ascoidea rubescens DSM 1968]ODV61962.1 HAD-superfamily phosphatase [Ascoidea rubescens DSM 1968]
MNISATLNSIRLLFNPNLALPHQVCNDFNSIKVPIGQFIIQNQPKIKAIVLDKDNCFAEKGDDKVYAGYTEKWKELINYYSKNNILIVSNSAGTNDDINHSQAKILEKETGIAVLRHSTKKPGCYNEIIDHFKKRGIVNGPEEILIVGDRLFTDVLMANLMGSWSIWIKNGVVRSESIICKFERYLYKNLVKNSNNFPQFPKNANNFPKGFK